jgi:hypothetical protein
MGRPGSGRIYSSRKRTVEGCALISTSALRSFDALGFREEFVIPMWYSDLSGRIRRSVTFRIAGRGKQ